MSSRADRTAETRDKIVEAAITLHQAKGVSATSMRDVAAEAGVGHATVYRHFRDDAELLNACSGLYLQRNPPPDPEGWNVINDPEVRLRRGLDEIYAYHDRTADMILSVGPELRGTPQMEPMVQFVKRCVGILASGFPKPDAELNAALELAVTFETWHALVRQAGLSRGAAIDIMVGMCLACNQRATGSR